VPFHFMVCDIIHCSIATRSSTICRNCAYAAPTLGCTCALLLEPELEASEGEGAPAGGGMGGSRGLGLMCFATPASVLHCICVALHMCCTASVLHCKCAALHMCDQKLHCSTPPLLMLLQCVEMNRHATDMHRTGTEMQANYISMLETCNANA
jgi:hypothetical protein